MKTFSENKFWIAGLFAVITLGTTQASDGPHWSDTLPGTYANCISKKNTQGTPIISDGFVTCEMDSDGKIAGTSTDGLSVIDSDAVEACHAIGESLPNQDDFKNLTSAQITTMQGYWFWSSSLYPVNSAGGLSFIDGNEVLAYRNDPGSVRCVSR